MLSIKDIAAYIFFVFVLISCKKDTIERPVCTEKVNTDTVKPKIRFMFINRNGYKQDTTVERWLQSVNLQVKFYNPQTNSSNINQTAYNRNLPLYSLNDSIEHRRYLSLKGAQYAFEVRLFWYYHAGIQFSRELKFQTRNWPDACDTIKVERDTVIKFTYPEDTLPNTRFMRVK